MTETSDKISIAFILLLTTMEYTSIHRVWCFAIIISNIGSMAIIYFTVTFRSSTRSRRDQSINHIFTFINIGCLTSTGSTTISFRSASRLRGYQSINNVFTFSHCHSESSGSFTSSIVYYTLIEFTPALYFSYLFFQRFVF